MPLHIFKHKELSYSEVSTIQLRDILNISAELVDYLFLTQ